MPRKRQRAKERRLRIDWSELREHLHRGCPFGQADEADECVLDDGPLGYLNLLTDGYRLLYPVGTPFDEELVALLWRELGAEIVREHARHHPGTRPWGFWTYDAPEPRQSGEAYRRACWRDADGKRFHERGLFCGCDDSLAVESEAEFLERHDLLTETEARALESPRLGGRDAT